MQEQPIGAKIHYYRKRAEMSQLDLETAIDASPGSISRIESGKVNPTKETLIAISNALNLTLVERSKLLDIIGLLPTAENVQAAKSEVKDYLNKPGVMAYLIDEWVFLHDVSETFLQFVGITRLHFETQLAGKHLYEVIFNPAYGIKTAIDPDHFAVALSNEMRRTKYEIDLPTYLPELFAQLMNYPDFAKLWNETEQTIDTVFSPIAKQVSFVRSGQKIRLYFSREKLKANPRFELIEYFSPEEQTGRWNERQLITEP